MRGRDGWLPVLFFLSGAAALIYEIVWCRMLALVMGTEVHAVSTVLASFFLGMALGSWLFGRLCRRMRRPGVVFAFMEAAIGAYALAVPWLLRTVESIYVGGVPSPGAGPEGRLPLMFALSFAILLVPATLMGGTFPVLLQAFWRRESGGRSVSILYGANTAGAVVGTFSAGFLLLATFGVRASLLAGFVLNWVVAAGAYAWDVGTRFRETEARLPAAGTPPEPAPRDARSIALLAGSAVAGFCALGCEVLWVRSLVFLVGFSVYAFAAMLTTFILGFSLGGWIVSTFIDRVRRRVLVLGVVQMCVGVSILVSPWLFGRVRDVAEAVFHGQPVVSLTDRALFMFLAAGTVMLPATVGMGMAFPLFLHAYLDGGSGRAAVGGRAGRLLALNTLGGTLGSLAAGFLLIDLVGIRGGLLALGLLAALCGATLALGFSGVPLRRRLVAAAVPACAVLVCLPARLGPTPLMDPALWGVDGELASYEEDHTAAVSVIRNHGKLTMTINSTVIHESIDPARPELVNDFVTGHLPMLLHPDPRDVLQIGMGTAVTLGSIGVHPAERIVAVEICPAVPRAARLFDAANRRILDDPRLELILNDGRNQLLIDPRRYDVIITDAWLSMVTGVSPLSTVEHYELVRDRLKPGGLFVPGPAMLDETFLIQLRTLLDVFPHIYLFSFPGTGCFTPVASMQPLLLDPDRLREKFRDPALETALELLRLERPEDLLATYLCETDCLERFAGAGRRDTDDLPASNYLATPMPSAAVHAPFDWTSPGSEIDRLLGMARSPLDILVRRPGRHGSLAEIRRLANANRAAIRAENATERADKLALYRKALQIDDRNPTASAALAALSRPAQAPAAVERGEGAAVRLRRPLTVIPAERFHARSGGAAARPGWALWNNGYLSVDVESAEPATWSFRMRARSDLLDGAGARVAVMVDDREAALLSVDVEQWSDFTLPLRLSAGRHTLWLLFTNDAVGPGGGDRNLYVEHVALETDDPLRTVRTDGERGAGG